MDVPLEERQVRRAYDFYSPIYDFLFKKIFEPGRIAAVRLLGQPPRGHVLEVGIGTGLNLPFYPATIDLVGIDLSEAMLRKAQDKVHDLHMEKVTLKVMDASAMDFGDDEFDSALATYVISAVPDPVTVLREMRRVTKPGGSIVILNHFRSENSVMRRIEDVLAPVCAHLGWKTNLALTPLLETVGLTPEVVRRVNLLRGWHLVKCVNRK
ncbi:MAG: methyltransferase domain-containing protein [Candidatus Rokubacteria bacterium]|nr:methyltransferase domain-containing protein [Candidatus Rokubacteria bacterium]